MVFLETSMILGHASMVFLEASMILVHAPCGTWGRGRIWCYQNGIPSGLRINDL
jgi:hypothetical protein